MEVSRVQLHSQTSTQREAEVDSENQSGSHRIWGQQVEIYSIARMKAKMKHLMFVFLSNSGRESLSI